MKIIWFKGARSNQIFHCALYERLKLACPDEKIYGFYHQRFVTDVHKYYELEIPPKCLLSEIIGGVFSILRKFFHIKFLCSTDGSFHTKALFYDGYWQNLDVFGYFGRDWLKFKGVENLATKNIEVIEKMLSSESIAVHIRRGDYLKLASTYGNTSLDYFNRAIEYGRERFQSPIFFFFSDDIDWVRDNLGNKEKDCYVDWNVGKDSYLDMYLMSFAKANIIANSTFSYWAAYIRPKQFVIYPKQWYGIESGLKAPNLFPKDWIAM